MRSRLILSAPQDADSAAIEKALSAGDVAALVIPAGATHLRAIVAATQNAGAAALLGYDFAEGDRPPWPLAYGADGVHAAGDLAARSTAVDTRPEGATIGAIATNRHEAMSLGELGADYLWFGNTRTLDEEAVELGIWWQAVFEIPAVVAGPCNAAAIDLMIATKVEFIAVDVFSSAEDPGDWVMMINNRLDQGLASS
ncbi:thiamine phosphate synthase [Acuticoccus sp. M5D2P5]|uniref:thiamine phosphate synthase n=1 Tax=Acuticoccus kalidii TaxID=2910977 RepID=UPI001F26BF5F|nr:thiamine phosphate synthase [Acuticoccus kalidii]MCF3932758.1 thiamine phosphate synthase [Acuticoccus kalidii]